MRKCTLLFIGICLFHSFVFAEGDTLTVEGFLYSDERPVAVRIAGGNIVQVISLSPNESIPEYIIAPGFIDIQINGFMGVDFSDQNLSLEMMRKATRALWKEGVTSFLPTVITNESLKLKRSFTLLSEAARDQSIGRSIAGFHLEGPYISPVKGFRGAHNEAFIRPADWDEFSMLQKVSLNRIKLVTLAPEIPGAIPFIEKASQNDVVVALGHHNGTTDIIQQAVQAGAVMSTHLGNGCANEINRHFNPLWPQLANECLSISMICDGSHLNRDEVVTFYKVKGNDQTILVSDALYLAGMPPGEYTRDGETLLLTDEVVKLPAENVLAGAAQSVRRCAENMMLFTRCELKDVIKMTCTNPAKILRLSDRGEIRPGMRADLILFRLKNGKILIEKTIVEGEIVYSAN